MSGILHLVKSDLLAHGCRVTFIGFIISLFSSPGFLVVTIHRVCFSLRKRSFVERVISRLLWRLGILVSGCYISPKASIGEGFHLPHPVGVVVGDTAVLGRFVTLYQGVTIGAKDGTGYPVIGDRVTVFANSVVVSNVNLGDGCTIGALSYVSHDIPCGVVAYGVPARVISSG